MNTFLCVPLRDFHLSHITRSINTDDLPLDQLRYTIFYSVVSGNVMGSSINSVDHLINLPNGCGEQNMASFASALSVLSYMNNTGTLQNQLLDHTKEYLVKGRYNVCNKQIP